MASAASFQLAMIKIKNFYSKNFCTLILFMASVPSIVRIYLFSAIFSYSFGLSDNVVGLYLEMLLAPINSVLVNKNSPNH